MSRPRTERASTRAARLIAALTALGAAGGLAACSNADDYWDHRDTVALSGGDAVAANSITQEVDPWPAYAGNKNIPYNGQKMQVAVERYRTGTVIPPVSAVTSDAAVPPPVPPVPPVSSGPPGAAPGAAISTTAQP